ncbi:cell cycle regulatory protein [Aspergillus pseudotamarii]|uniref:Cell cycle regulatory protein n=1 Tax=Aspergillus pseudotamarii TaxID=132259 RepID=A0A5N6SFD6_ASPPS|nr:cell cycle regulatory protein [Aspergillus pseudotamarii]KAE8133382.1 cell cycle regulatory protein [Aspergillus pseudotamarii]
MIGTQCHVLQKLDRLMESRPSTPELSSDTSSDDDSNLSVDRAITPPPLIGPVTHYAANLGTGSPFSGEGQHKARRSTTTNTNGGLSRSPASPDRFIPVRQFMNPLSTLFRIGKNPQELSPEERFLRHRSQKEDPFMPTRPRRSESTPGIPSGRPLQRYYGPRFINIPAIMRIDSPLNPEAGHRQVSNGAVWHVGGASAAVGRRSRTTSSRSERPLTNRTAAPMYNASFLPSVESTEEQSKYESRVALALDIDPARALLNSHHDWSLLESTPAPFSPLYERFSPLIWKDNAWKKAEKNSWSTTPTPRGDNARIVPTLPFRILDAPNLRDDFYCSTLAYSTTSGILAVGLGHHVYLWSEAFGVQYPPFADQHPSNYITSLSFSSECGEKGILAVGRHSGTLSLWSVFDSEIRFEINHPSTITCVAFKHVTSRRISERFKHVEVDTEDLAVGDNLGNIWYYSVEWPDDDIREDFDWQGSMTLIARISAHTQQVCGISWSPDGTFLATGGNDNACMLFELQDIIPPGELGIISKCSNTLRQSRLNLSVENTHQQLLHRHFIARSLPTSSRSGFAPVSTALLSHVGSLISDRDRTVMVPPNYQKHRLVHSAAVKAIAFAPWQPSLLATGGGSNDRAIHFYHTPSGACLATINVYAQVTSLIWSKTRREIVATFGFAQPEHPFRIAVFAWPSCEQIAAIPWGPNGSSWDRIENESNVDCGRALCAVSYPCRPPTYVLDKLDNHDGSSISSFVNQHRSNRKGGSVHYRRAVVRPRAKEGGLWCPRTVEEGCIIVASSDQSVKFHEVWSSGRKQKAAASGPYGGSEILEGIEGLEAPGKEVIR